ncbi:MAG: hypothetical protein IT379_07635 [Deltaproteobacteria bacterium]|nr:hypothetical protein [Deltaproteobacteria bacterium]
MNQIPTAHSSAGMPDPPARVRAKSVNFVDAAVHFDLPASQAAFAQREGAYHRYGREIPCEIYFLRDESGASPVEEALLRVYATPDWDPDIRFDVDAAVRAVLS